MVAFGGCLRKKTKQIKTSHILYHQVKSNPKTKLVVIIIIIIIIIILIIINMAASSNVGVKHNVPQ